MGRLVRSGRVVPAERVEALAEAGELLARARGEAAGIVAAARAEAESIRDEERRAARQAGTTEAAALLAEAAVARERALAGMQEEIVDLALEVARKVVARDLEVSRSGATEICAAALARVRRSRAVLLRVHPEELPKVEASSKLLASVLAEGAGLRVVADDEVGRGGCVIESDLGRVDARLDTQLAAIERALRKSDD